MEGKIKHNPDPNLDSGLKQFTSAATSRTALHCHEIISIPLNGQHHSLQYNKIPSQLGSSYPDIPCQTDTQSRVRHLKTSNQAPGGGEHRQRGPRSLQQPSHILRCILLSKPSTRNQVIHWTYDPLKEREIESHELAPEFKRYSGKYNP